MEILILVCKRFNVNPAQVFRCAFDYSEVRIHSTEMEDYFLSCCCRRDCFGDINLVYTLPNFVKNYCFDLLVGITKLPSQEEIEVYN